MTDCPKCEKPMVRREGMFYWRGDSKPGWVCEQCNSLWPIAGEAIEPLESSPATAIGNRRA